MLAARGPAVFSRLLCRLVDGLGEWRTEVDKGEVDDGTEAK